MNEKVTGWEGKRVRGWEDGKQDTPDSLIAGLRFIQQSECYPSFKKQVLGYKIKNVIFLQLLFFYICARYLKLNSFCNLKESVWKSGITTFYFYWWCLLLLQLTTEKNPAQTAKRRRKWKTLQIPYRKPVLFQVQCERYRSRVEDLPCGSGKGDGGWQGEEVIGWEGGDWFRV